MHQGMEFPPAVVVGVEEEGLEEEQQDVREKSGREHAHHVVRELRIQDDEHERQGRAEGRGQREGDREELRELVGQPVVSQISGLVADRLDDEREDGDGKDERREQQVKLRDHPDSHTAPDAGKPSGTRPPRKVFPAPCSPRRASRRPLPPTGRSGLGQAVGYSRLPETIFTAAANITRPATGPRRTSSVRFVTTTPSMADRSGARSAWDLVLLEGAGGDTNGSQFYQGAKLRSIG